MGQGPIVILSLGTIKRRRPLSIINFLVQILDPVTTHVLESVGDPDSPVGTDLFHNVEGGLSLIIITTTPTITMDPIWRLMRKSSPLYVGFIGRWPSKRGSVRVLSNASRL